MFLSGRFELEMVHTDHSKLHNLQYANKNITILVACMTVIIRVGFTLSRALFRKKCGALTWDGRSYFSCMEKLATFFGHRCRFYSFTRVFPIISGMQKVAAPLVGPLFVGAPVRSNMLNMPKSAAGYNCLLWYTGPDPLAFSDSELRTYDRCPCRVCICMSHHQLPLPVGNVKFAGIFCRDETTKTPGMSCMQPDSAVPVSTALCAESGYHAMISL